MNNLGNIMQMVNTIKQNPMAMLSKFNVPQNIANDPQAIIQYMMNSGKISQEQYNAAIKQAQNMGMKQ
jgi:hypothetical protein